MCHEMEVMIMCVYVCSRVCSIVSDSVTSKTVARQSSLSLEFIQAMLMEWVAISYSRESSWPRDRIRVSCGSCTGRQVLYHCITWEALRMILHPPPKKYRKGRKLWNRTRLGTGGGKAACLFLLSWAEGSVFYNANSPAPVKPVTGKMLHKVGHL